MSKRQHYTEEFKRDAVRVVQSRGTRSIADVASSLRVSKSMLYRWTVQYGAEVTGRAASSQRAQEDVEALRRRVRQLEQENAFLKKAAALFAKEVR